MKKVRSSHYGTDIIKTQIFPVSILKFSPKEYYEWTSELRRRTMHGLRVLKLKNHSTKSCFSRLQLRGKKWFTFTYFLKILATPCRIHSIREHLSVNASGFSYDRTQEFLAENAQLMYYNYNVFGKSNE